MNCKAMLAKKPKKKVLMLLVMRKCSSCKNARHVKIWHNSPRIIYHPHEVNQNHDLHWSSTSNHNQFCLPMECNLTDIHVHSAASNVAENHKVDSSMHAKWWIQKWKQTGVWGTTSTIWAERCQSMWWSAAAACYEQGHSFRVIDGDRQWESTWPIAYQSLTRCTSSTWNSIISCISRVHQFVDESRFSAPLSPS